MVSSIIKDKLILLTIVEEDKEQMGKNRYEKDLRLEFSTFLINPENCW